MSNAPQPDPVIQMTSQARAAPVASSEPNGWAWFAGVMIAVAGIFNVLNGIVGLTDANYYASLATTHGIHLPVTDTIRTWAWTAIGVGAVMIAASIGVVAGYLWARVLGVIIVGLDMVYQLGFIPAYPFWGLVIMAIDILVIYALVVHVHRAKRPA